MNSPVTNPTTSAATAPADTVMMSVSRLNSTTLASTLGFSASTRPPPVPPRLLGPLLCRVSAASSRATAAPGLSWLMTVPSLALVAGGVAGAGHYAWRPVGTLCRKAAWLPLGQDWAPAHLSPRVSQAQYCNSVWLDITFTPSPGL